jgi:hypothetical protein
MFWSQEISFRYDSGEPVGLSSPVDFQGSQVALLDCPATLRPESKDIAAA